MTHIEMFADAGTLTAIETDEHGHRATHACPEPHGTAPAPWHRLAPRDLATVLAALRYWQRRELSETFGRDASPDHFEDHDPLSAAEIDSLCERLNAGEDENASAYIDAARELYHRDGDCEIDDDAIVSAGDDAGAYVMAWVWVRDIDAGIAPELEHCPHCDCANPADYERCLACSERAA